MKASSDLTKVLIRGVSGGRRERGLDPVRVGWLAIAILVIAPGLGYLRAEESATKSGVSVTERSLTRVFIQDAQTLTLKWADLLSQQPPVFSEPREVEGFPKLAPERQSLVQMAASAGKILVGVRDTEDGEFQSGWVLIDTGVEEEEHGDHSHWYYNAAPRVIATRLDESQGNPAHLYCYDGVFYLANDSIGGFTRIDPAAIPAGADEAEIRSLAAFHAGGNGHITIAVAGDLAFSTWMSRDEANAKRIDVTQVKASGNRDIAFSFNAHRGGLHGATHESGKVFFAPSGGIDWITAPASAKENPDDLAVNHIDLGSDGEKPRRTGSFVNHGGHVLFTSGSGESSFLALIDARAEVPEVIRVPIEVDARSRAHGPIVVQTRSSGPLAYVFHDHPKDAGAPNIATVIRMDPNGDGDFSDAEVTGRLHVGASSVQGHGGHHDMASDASGRWGMIVNPGDQTLQVVLTTDGVTQFTDHLPFTPGRILAVGGRGPIR
jgi:hypothetical protein